MIDSNIVSIDYPGIKSWGSDISKLTGIVFPGSLESYSSQPGSFDNSLKTVTFLDGIKYAYVGDFYNVDTIYLPTSLTKITGNFEGSNAIVIYDGTDEQWNTIEGHEILDEARNKYFYKQYAENILNNLPTDEMQRNENLEEMFIQGLNYWNKVQENTMEPEYENFDKYVEYQNEQYGAEFTDLQSVANAFVYESIEKFLIDFKYINPEGFYGNT